MWKSMEVFSKTSLKEIKINVYIKLRKYTP
nr:MAG TPA: hypothetical protein [Caudoviricetes sp.]